jgi:hypothetical protein
MFIFGFFVLASESFSWLGYLMIFGEGIMVLPWIYITKNGSNGGIYHQLFWRTT